MKKKERAYDILDFEIEGFSEGNVTGFEIGVKSAFGTLANQLVRHSSN